MKILLAPDSFKGSLSSKNVCNALKEGIKKVIDADIIEAPIADGGEGTVESFVSLKGGEIINAYVSGPLGEKINAFYGILNDGTAIIEIVAAAGLYLIPKSLRNPLKTTTYGVGELIRLALDQGCRKFIIGLGGSGTIDGGVGMAQALGVKFIDNCGKEIDFGGGNLNKVAKIDISKIDNRLYESEFIIASDVNNPLFGKYGASYVFGKQKGATDEMIEILDDNLKHYAKVVEDTFGKNISDVSGAGAAGGLGFGLMAILNAKIRSGIEIMVDVADLENKIKYSDIVITGEGNTDYQIKFGKALSGIANLGRKYGKPVIVLSGGLGDGYKQLYNAGFTAFFSIIDKPMTINDAMKNTCKLIVDRTEDIIRTIILLNKSELI